MTEKRCSRCYKIKPLSAYSKQRHGSQGRKAECKACQVIANRERRQLHHWTKQDNKCWKCGKKLLPMRFQSECKRMTREGFGTKLPKCSCC